jgi:hypothetical protein
MKQHIATGILAASVVVGIGTGVAAHALGPDDPEEKPRATPTVTATATPSAPEKTSSAPQTQPTPPPPAAPALLPVSAMVITPGAVGPLGVGMTKSQALATGYAEENVQLPGCAGLDWLQYKPAYRPTLIMGTEDDGQIDNIRVRGPGPHTRSGLQVGSSYGSVKAVLGPDVAPEVTARNQAGLYVSEGAHWLGFLFDATVDTLTDETPVKMIEIRVNAKPNLIFPVC